MKQTKLLLAETISAKTEVYCNKKIVNTTEMDCIKAVNAFVEMMKRPTEYTYKRKMKIDVYNNKIVVYERWTFDEIVRKYTYKTTFYGLREGIKWEYL